MTVNVDDLVERIESQSTERGTFVPYVSFKMRTVSVPLILVRISAAKLPHGLVMHQYDSVMGTHAPFDSFVVDTLYIEYEDQTRETIIEACLPESSRTFAVPNTKEGRYRSEGFPGVIRKRMGFKVYLRGEAIPADGSSGHPFNREVTYAYGGKDIWFVTAWEALESRIR